MKILIILVSLLSCQSPYIKVRSLANQQFSLGDNLQVSSQQIQEIYNQLEKTKSDKRYFHWTKIDVGVRWASQGFLDKGEVDFYNIKTGKAQSYGAGIYLAESPTSSQGFGDYPVTFLIRQGTPIYDGNKISKILGRALSRDQITELGKHIPFIRSVTGDWWLTHHPQNTSVVEYAGAYGAKIKMNSNNLINTKLILEFISSLSTAAPEKTSFLESFIHLHYYIDGISLQRAIQVAPDNPWSQFEPENFENFKNVHKQILGLGRTINNNRWMEDNIEKEAWIAKQIDSEIFGINQMLLPNVKSKIRNDRLFAGGSEGQNEFFEEPHRLVSLLDNPYLTVHYRPHENLAGFYVKYEYPHVSHFQKFKNIISEDLFNELKSYDLAQLQPNDPGSAELNNKFIRELLHDLFNQLYAKEIDQAEFLHKFISIHPFKDANGRTARMYLQKVVTQRGYHLPPFYLSDLDLLINPKQFKQIINDSEIIYNEVFNDYVSELLSKLGKGHFPDYYKALFNKDLSLCLKIYGVSGLNQFPTIELEQIRQRQFNHLFSKRFGHGWNLSKNDLNENFFELIKKYPLTAYINSLRIKLKNLILDLSTNPTYQIDKVTLASLILATIEKDNPELTLRSEYKKMINTYIANPSINHTNKKTVLEQYFLSFGYDYQRILDFIDENIEQHPDQSTKLNIFLRESRTNILFRIESKKFLSNSISINDFIEKIKQNDDSKITLNEQNVDELKKILNKIQLHEIEEILKNFQFNSLTLFNTLFVEFKTICKRISCRNQPSFDQFILNSIAHLISNSNISEIETAIDVLTNFGSSRTELFLKIVSNENFQVVNLPTNIISTLFERVIEELKAKPKDKNLSISMINLINSNVIKNIDFEKVYDIVDWDVLTKEQIEKLWQYLNTNEYDSRIYKKLIKVSSIITPNGSEPQLKFLGRIVENAINQSKPYAENVVDDLLSFRNSNPKEIFLILHGMSSSLRFNSELIKIKILDSFIDLFFQQINKNAVLYFDVFIQNNFTYFLNKVSDKQLEQYFSFMDENKTFHTITKIDLLNNSIEKLKNLHKLFNKSNNSAAHYFADYCINSFIKIPKEDKNRVHAILSLILDTASIDIDKKVLIIWNLLAKLNFISKDEAIKFIKSIKVELAGGINNIHKKPEIIRFPLELIIESIQDDPILFAQLKSEIQKLNLESWKIYVYNANRDIFISPVSSHLFEILEGVPYPERQKIAQFLISHFSFQLGKGNEEKLLGSLVKSISFLNEELKKETIAKISKELEAKNYHNIKQNFLDLVNKSTSCQTNASMFIQ